jgi:hypothetical protein
VIPGDKPWFLTGDGDGSGRDKPIRVNLAVEQAKNESGLRQALQYGFNQLKEGKFVEFNVDRGQKYSTSDGKTLSQGDIYMQEKGKAFPDSLRTFIKPDYSPGDAGYQSYPTGKGEPGWMLSTQEKPIVLTSATNVTLPDGTQRYLDPGTQLSPGTIMSERDGKTRIWSADPEHSVWATPPAGPGAEQSAGWRPNGTEIALTNPHSTLEVPSSGFSSGGQSLAPKPNGEPTFFVSKDQAKGEHAAAPLDPAGKPFQDAYTQGESVFHKKNKPDPMHEGYYSVKGGDKWDLARLQPREGIAHDGKVIGHGTDGDFIASHLYTITEGSVAREGEGRTPDLRGARDNVALQHKLGITPDYETPAQQQLREAIAKFEKAGLQADYATARDAALASGAPFADSPAAYEANRLHFHEQIHTALRNGPQFRGVAATAEEIGKVGKASRLGKIPGWVGLAIGPAVAGAATLAATGDARAAGRAAAESVFPVEAVASGNYLEGVLQLPEKWVPLGEALTEGPRWMLRQNGFAVGPSVGERHESELRQYYSWQEVRKSLINPDGSINGNSEMYKRLRAQYGVEYDGMINQARARGARVSAMPEREKAIHNQILAFVRPLLGVRDDLQLAHIPSPIPRM